MRIAITAGLSALLCFAAAPAAMARDHSGVNWSVNVGVPGPVVYGPPVVYQPQPVYVQPRAVYVQPRAVYVQPAPVYYSSYGRPYYGHRGHGYYRHHHHGHW